MPPQHFLKVNLKNTFYTIFIIVWKVINCFHFPLDLILFLKKKKLNSHKQQQLKKKTKVKYKSQIKAGQSSNTEQKKNILHFEGPFYQISNLEDFSIHCWFWQRSHNLFSFPFSSPFVPCSFLSLASGNVGSHPPKETLTFREETLGFPGG